MPIIYREDEDGTIWLCMPDLINALKGIRFGGQDVGSKIADRIELVVYRDRMKNVRKAK